MARNRFVTAINCMDGRVQEPVIRWMTRRLGADYVDMVTEPGPESLLASGRTAEVESIRRRVQISVNAHQSKAVAIVGHHDCAGNPVSDEVHVRQVEQAAGVLSGWGLDVRLLGLWVNDRWTVQLVCDSEGLFT